MKLFSIFIFIFQLPKLFFLNVFLRGYNNEFEWPGFGENIRILAWIIRRLSAQAGDDAISSPIGLIPQQEAIDLQVSFY